MSLPRPPLASRPLARSMNTPRTPLRPPRAASPDVAPVSAPTDDFRANGAQADRSAEIYGPSPVAQSTLTVHGGEREGRPRVSDSLTTPIVQVSLGEKREGEACVAGAALHLCAGVVPQTQSETWAGVCVGG